MANSFSNGLWTTLLSQMQKEKLPKHPELNFSEQQLYLMFSATQFSLLSLRKCDFSKSCIFTFMASQVIGILKEDFCFVSHSCFAWNWKGPILSFEPQVTTQCIAGATLSFHQVLFWICSDLMFKQLNKASRMVPHFTGRSQFPLKTCRTLLRKKFC